MLKILLIEDEFIIARDIKTILEKDNYSIVMITRNLQSVLDVYHKENVDLIISDVNLNLNIDGIEIVSKLMDIKKVPVVYLTAYSDNEIISRAEKTSPFAYLLKPYNENQLKLTINLALLNYAKLKEKISINEENTKMLKLLTTREKQVLVIMSSGKISKEIADVLNISVLTVEKHKQNIKAKLNLRTMGEMIKFTMTSRLFELTNEL